MTTWSQSCLSSPKSKCDNPGQQGVGHILAWGWWEGFGERCYRPMLMRRQGWLTGGRRWAAVAGAPSWPWVAGALPGVGSATLRSLELVFAPEVSVSAGRSGALGLAHRPLTAFCLSLRLISGQASPHRPLQTSVRRANMGSTFFLAQCIPEPLSRASTTSLLALSTAPLPMGYPCAWNSAYLVCPFVSPSIPCCF